MASKSLYNPFVRKIVTTMLLLLITMGFLGIYYFTYLPQEHAQYNQRTFRILHEIASNFNTRVDNYGTVYINKYISNNYKDSVIHVKNLPAVNDSIHNSKFDDIFRSSFKGNALNNDLYQSRDTLLYDSILYHIKKTDTSAVKTQSDKHNDIKHLDTLIKKSLGDILEPLISLHADVFESVLLIKQTSDSAKSCAKNMICHDSILYESEQSDIANINTDSLYQNKNIEGPVVTDLEMENTGYKMFLLPFKIKANRNQTFVLAGLITNGNYRQQSQSIPINLLISLSILLVLLLLLLPFLKIFFISAEENFKISDVRTIITVVFIIPFFVIMVCGGISLFLYNDKLSNEVLSSIQKNVQANFYKEIGENIKQLKRYDSIIKKPSAFIDPVLIDSAKHFNSLYKKDSFDLKDAIFYPSIYKKITSMHWLDTSGNDIAAWSLNNIPAPYFKLGDRKYFQDIQLNNALILPDLLVKSDAIHYNNIIDTFTIQPVLSRLTGDYTVNVAIPSHSEIAGKKAIAIGLSSKMYSIYNTVVPYGYSYCIIDQAGTIVCHSDTARSLQENIFEESNDSFALRNIINHKDSALLQDFSLYGQPVNLMIKPLPALPYYLITYYNKRGKSLFIFHVLAFVFVCQAALLLLAALFSYLMMLSEKTNSKLFFSTAVVNWLRPSPDKTIYYLKNSIQFVSSAFLIFLAALFFKDDAYYLFLLNGAVLLPLFAVTGYHIIKKSAVFFKHDATKSYFVGVDRLLKFCRSIIHILLFYAASIAFFQVIKNALFYGSECAYQNQINDVLWLLIFLIPVMIIITAGINLKRITAISITNSKNYLVHFITSLLLSVLLICVIPAITFMSYAFKEEKTMQLQSLQVNLAKKIQQRRNHVNGSILKTKLGKPFNDSVFVNQLKFEKNKGIYLPGNDDSIETSARFNDSSQNRKDCAPFYKLVTQYLFLPPDHDEFYNNPGHQQYYYWCDSSFANNDSLVTTLHYKNATDNFNRNNISLKSVTGNTNLLKNFTGNYNGYLVLLGLLFGAMVFYITIYSSAKKIFLVDFFNDAHKNAADKLDNEIKKQEYRQSDFKTKIHQLFSAHNAINFKLIRDTEDKKLNEDNDSGFIIQSQLLLNQVYEDIWQSCTDVQKYTLYDFATDGFTNYKKVLTLYELYNAGLLVKEPDGHITFITKSFRNFLITKETSPEVKKLSSQNKRGSWGNLRTVLYVVLISLAVFIFISQDEASKRLLTVVTSLGALLPAILRLFDKSTLPSAGSNKN